MAKKDNNNEKLKNNFSKELKSEMKKVTWPSFKQLVNNTSAVISIVLIVAIIVFVLDVCFENVNKFGVEKLKSAVSSDAETSEETEGKTEDSDGIQLITDGDTDAETVGEETDSNTESTDTTTEVPAEGSTEEVAQ